MQVNPEIESFDIAMVIGANDTVNSAAIEVLAGGGGPRGRGGSGVQRLAACWAPAGVVPLQAEPRSLPILPAARSWLPLARLTRDTMQSCALCWAVATRSRPSALRAGPQLRDCRHAGD